MKKILITFALCLVVFQVPVFARGRTQSEPIRKIAVISLVDDTMCVYIPKKQFFGKKDYLYKVPFEHSAYLNDVIQQQFSSLLNENFEVVSIRNWEARIHQDQFFGMKDFRRFQENCNTVYQMVQESQVDAILFIHPFSKTDITRENNTYAGGGGGGFLGGFIAGALSETIKQATGSQYMTAPEIWGDRVWLHLTAGLYDVRGWRSGNIQAHPKLLQSKTLDFGSKYRSDRVSSTVSPTSEDKMMMCEVIRLCLEKDAAKTLSRMKLYPKSK